MKKNIAISICLTLCSVALLRAAEVEFKASPKPVRRDLAVYKMVAPRLSEEDALKKSARVFESSNLKAIPRASFKSVGNRLAYSANDLQVSVSKDGSEFHFTNFPALKLTERTGKLASDEEAIQRSLSFLKTAVLMPRNQAELKVDHVGGIMQMLSNANTPEKKAVVVYFYRELDGMRVCNYGSSITMTLADSNAPAGVQYHWREVANRERVAPRAAVSSAKVLDSIRADVNNVYAKDSKVIIDKIDLVLYDNGGGYIQPAYRYQGVRLGDGKQIADMPVLGYVPALTKVYEPIRHPAFSPDRKAPTERVQAPPKGKDE
jgi:hypothetical protein